MKKFNLSLVAVLAMSTFAVAGGDIAPVEEPVVVVEPVVESTGNFYLGLAYSYITAENKYTDDLFRPADHKSDITYSGVTFQGGYKFNDYIAVEGRYVTSFNDGEVEINDVDYGEVANVDVDGWGIYVKPMYPVTDAFDIYALLGYANTNINYKVVDYVSMYDDTFEDSTGKNELTVDSWNFGVTYNF
jgi:hypothetical protein